MRIEDIKRGLSLLLKNAPVVRVSLRMNHPRVTLEEKPARLVGVYENIFQLAPIDGTATRRYTVRYSEVLIGQVVIAELEQALRA